MSKGNPKPLSHKLRAETEALAAMPESEIDASEMPEITDWSAAVRGYEHERGRGKTTTSDPHF
jgi:hypothetical protein